VPTVANGKVYVGAQYALAVYGLGAFPAPPVFAPAGGVFSNSVSVTITDASPGVTIYYTQDGSVPTMSSTLYTVPILITNTVRLQARAFKTGSPNSGTTSAVYLSTNSVGNGTGLTGAYYANQLATFTNPPTLVRTDSVVNFNWGTGSPDPSITSNDFTAIWTGEVQPQFSEAYTFYTTTDDGTRLWVNGQLLVDDWVNQAATQENGTLALVAGQKYPITMEYYQNQGLSSATLAWSSSSTPMAIIPQSQLYPSYASALFPLAGRITNGAFNLQVAGAIGKGYVLQASTNLTTWVPIQTNVPMPDPNGALPTNIFNFSDPTVTNHSWRFYRTVQQP
jgi:hypothetical protein